MRFSYKKVYIGKGTKVAPTPTHQNCLKPNQVKSIQQGSEFLRVL